ncbi:hypothetical protein [Microlunatus soli]|uniref:Uncharacterized protein n=1 Tax=Microlunatus soli TaxID=630515 RepID=A0A1H1YQ91_9ACTN|nr:hypothetical protein [Microlunatus soli]SDT23502.1 hypothetical protein SAMN04489812_4713 [Microlunatus soli]
MTTGNGFLMRHHLQRIATLGLPSRPTVVSAAISYPVGVGVIALIPAFDGFAPLPIWQLAVRLVGVWVVAFTIDHVVRRVVGSLVARTARDPERSRYTVVDAISGAVLFGVLALGLSLVLEPGSAVVAALIVAVLSGIVEGVLTRV